MTMIYGFKCGNAMIFIVADDHELALEALLANGYKPDGEFENMGMVLVVKSHDGSEVFVSESR